MMRLENSTRKNFTLLELVLATAIFAVLMVTSGLGLLAIQQSWKKIHYHSERLKSILAIDRVVELSFRNIIPFSWPEKDTKTEKSVFVGDSDKILFGTLHRINKGDANALRFITLYAQDGKLIAEYRNTPIIKDNKEDAGIQTEVLATGISAVSFLYLSYGESETLEWIDDWDEEKNQLNKVSLPVGVQMTVQWENGDSYSWLRRTAGSGKNQSLGMRKSGLNLPVAPNAPPALP